ncbi:haloacid dehalogenase [Infundibulicybe gibba]|nr:haloacid dehalogenase [Infundibulicybe gibba]
MVSKLTDHKVLIFDVYATLVNWEKGIQEALVPLLSKYPASKNWTPREAFLAFSEVETDLQAQFPDMRYSTLLAKIHETLDQRLKAAGAPLDVSTAADPGTSTSVAQNGNGHDTYKNAHIKFAESIQHWPSFPDTYEALRRLSKHFKLVVLSNTDNASFKYTHALLSEGTHKPSNLALYEHPSGPKALWLPRSVEGSQSPFSLILTAEDTHIYKPALEGFKIALEKIKTHPALLDNSGSKDVRDDVLVVAQSLTHDIEPAAKLGVDSVWIDRKGSLTGKDNDGEEKKGTWKWRFETLADMADAVEGERRDIVK